MTTLRPHLDVPPLDYHGRIMDPRPVNSDGLAYLAERYRMNHPIHVILEPGDATRYEFIITPMRFLPPQTFSYGNMRELRHKFFFTRFTGEDHHPTTVLDFRDLDLERPPHALRHPVAHGWTATIFVWALCHLRREIYNGVTSSWILLEEDLWT